MSSLHFFAKKTCRLVRKTLLLQSVFHSIRFKVNKGWGSAEPRFFCLLALLFLARFLTEKPPVTLHQFPYNEENIDGRHTVGNQAGDIVALAVAFTLDEGLIPE